MSPQAGPSGSTDGSSPDPTAGDSGGDVDGLDADGPGESDRRPAAVLADVLGVRRLAWIGLAVGVIVGLGIFVFFAYIPGTEEPLLYWAGLAVVLAVGVAALVTTVLVGIAAVRRARIIAEPARRGWSPTTLSLLVGVGGWIAVTVVASTAFDRPTASVALLEALAAGWFAALTVGSLGLKLVVALSLEHAWHPRRAVLAAVAYTGIVWAPSVDCPSGGACLGTPDAVVAATVGLGVGAASPAYLLVVLGGGSLVGAGVGLAGSPPSHGFLAGGVAAVASLPIVAATTGDPGTVRSTAVSLPVVLGLVGAFGTATLRAARPAPSGER